MPITTSLYRRVIFRHQDQTSRTFISDKLLLLPELSSSSEAVVTCSRKQSMLLLCGQTFLKMKSSNDAKIQFLTGSLSTTTTIKRYIINLLWPTITSEKGTNPIRWIKKHQRKMRRSGAPSPLSL